MADMERIYKTPHRYPGTALSFSSSYDAMGRPGDSPLTYDEEDRLAGYSTSMTAGYTSDGLRAWKQVGTTRVYYVYSGTTPICEINGSNGDIKAVNTFGPTGLLARHTDSGTTFYTIDPQGNVVQTLDSTGGVTATALYDAYGTKLNTGTVAPFGYGGQSGYYTDPETGLLLLTHRYYDPEEGRFLTRDPIGYSGEMNLYGYVGGNPVGFLHPLGLLTQEQYDKLVEIRDYAEKNGTLAAARRYSPTQGPWPPGDWDPIEIRKYALMPTSQGDMDFDWYLTLIAVGDGWLSTPLTVWAEYPFGKIGWNVWRYFDKENPERPSDGWGSRPFQDAEERRAVGALMRTKTIPELFPPGFLEKHRPPRAKNKRQKM